MDPEAPLRAELRTKLSPHFKTWEEVTLLTSQGKQVRADLLFIEDRFRDPFAVAVEIKSRPPKQPKNYRDTLLQAFLYINADLIDPRVPNTPVKFAMVYQSRPRRVGRTNEPLDIELMESIEMNGLELAFNSFCVGYIINSNELSMHLSHNRLWSEKKGWGEELKRRAPDFFN
jgi:hypothetical protein